VPEYLTIHVARIRVLLYRDICHTQPHAKEHYPDIYWALLTCRNEQYRILTNSGTVLTETLKSGEGNKGKEGLLKRELAIVS